MISRKGILAVLVMVAISPSAPAAAYVGYCGDRDEMAFYLSARHGERRVGGVIHGGISHRETYVNPFTGTFTVIENKMRGQACVVDEGEFERKQPKGGA